MGTDDDAILAAMASPPVRHRPDEFGTPDSWPGYSTLCDLHRLKQLHPGRDTPEHKRMRRQAELEQTGAAVLQRLAAAGAVILHDRRMPTRAERIEHIVITPSGVHLVHDLAVARKEAIIATPYGVLAGARPISPQLVKWRTSTDDVVAEIGAALPDWRITVYTAVVVHGRRPRSAPRRWVMHDIDAVVAADAAAWIDHRMPVLDPVDLAIVADTVMRLCPPAHT